MESSNNKSIKSFTDLLAWQASYKLCLFVYEASSTFPVLENFGLTSQMRRASVSATSNLAEGFGRSTPKDKERFYQTASGSLYELKSQSMVANGLGYLSASGYETLVEHADKAHKLLNGLIRSHRFTAKETNVDRLMSIV